jgi:hypothetical protein
VCVLGLEFATKELHVSAEQAIRAELDRLGFRPDESLLATAVLDLAKRLDAGPGDRAATMLVREIRLSMAELTRQMEGGDGAGDELERFLEGYDPTR